MEDSIIPEDAKLDVKSKPKVIESNPLNTVPKNERRKHVDIMKSSVSVLKQRLINYHDFINLVKRIIYDQ